MSMHPNLEFSASTDVINILGHAGSKAPEGYTVYLKGDLSQMASQKSFLLKRGFDLGQSDVYPVLKESDWEKALKAIWDSRVEGWWHYKGDLVKKGICSWEDFDDALDIQCGHAPRSKKKPKRKIEW